MAGLQLAWFGAQSLLSTAAALVAAFSAAALWLRLQHGCLSAQLLPQLLAKAANEGGMLGKVGAGGWRRQGGKVAP